MSVTVQSTLRRDLSIESSRKSFENFHLLVSMLAMLILCSSHTDHVMAADLKYSRDAWAGARHTAKKSHYTGGAKS